MRCYICSKLSIFVFCKKCTSQLLIPTISTRKVGTLDVISFFKYSVLESLLHTKHKPEGYRIYKALAELTFEPFMREFVESDDRDVYIVGIDEHVKSGYAHVSLLTRSTKMVHSIPLHSSLMATNRVNYSGKSFEFRINNPRNFKYSGKTDIDVILVDDIVTTGITLQEAQNTLLKHNVNVLFALTLADVKED